MSKKNKVALQVEITTEAEWEKFLAEDGMKVVDAYTGWCGPCIALAGHFKAIKNRVGDDLLKFAIVKTDDIESLKAYTGFSQPCILFYGKDTLVNVVRGANSPKITEVTEKELAIEHDNHEGKGERVPYVDADAGGAKEEKEPEAAQEEAAVEPSTDAPAAAPAPAPEVDNSQYGYIFIKPKVAQDVVDDFFVKLAESSSLKKELSSEITLNSDQSAVVLQGVDATSEDTSKYTAFIEGAPGQAVLVKLNSTGEAPKEEAEVAADGGDAPAEGESAAPAEEAAAPTTAAEAIAALLATMAKTTCKTGEEDAVEICFREEGAEDADSVAAHWASAFFCPASMESTVKAIELNFPDWVDDNNFNQRVEAAAAEEPAAAEETPAEGEATPAEGDAAPESAAVVETAGAEGEAGEAVATADGEAPAECDDTPAAGEKATDGDAPAEGDASAGEPAAEEPAAATADADAPAEAEAPKEGAAAEEPAAEEPVAATADADAPAETEAEAPAEAEAPKEEAAAEEPAAEEPAAATADAEAPAEAPADAEAPKEEAAAEEPAAAE